MKNHWLDKKIDREIDEAFEGAFTNSELNAEFTDTDFIDLNAEITKELDKEIIANLDIGIDLAEEEHDRTVVTEILLKYKDRPHWIDEILTDVSYFPAPDPFLCNIPGDITLDTSNVSNFTITLGDTFNQDTCFTISSGNVPGGDGIKTEDVKTSEFGEICPNCNTEMWPMNNAETMMQGDPMCACSNPCGNLDIFYPDNAFIQNETLQVLNDLNTDVTQYQTMYVPVMAGTMTGTIYPTPGNTSYGFVFYVSSSGKFKFTRFVNADGAVKYANGSNDPWKEMTLEESDKFSLEKLASGEFDDFMGWYDEAYVDGTTLNLQTGVLEFHYHMGKRPEIIVSYEYGREC